VHLKIIRGKKMLNKTIFEYSFIIYFKIIIRERQLQIDELTKELKRTQEEYDLLKHKIKGYKNKLGVSITTLCYSRISSKTLI
jgi:hypothetical protein